MNFPHIQYDGDKIVSERNNDNSQVLRYSYDTQGQLLKITKPSGAEYFPATDGLGSIIQVRDGNGDIMNSYQYDEWGKITSKTENFALSTRYASYWQDDGTGLYHLGSRWYDPNLNRFLLVDPHPGDQDDPVTLNEYTYTGSNPVIRTDADGNYFETALDLASVVYSISEFRKNKSIGNAGLVAFDGMMLALPVLPGSGTIRWIAKAGKSSNKVGNVRKITGYTAHGLEQALSREGRGVAPSAILDAVKNPSKTIKQAGKTTKYVGKRAVVVLNKTGKVVTTWAKNAKGWRIK